MNESVLCRASQWFSCHITARGTWVWILALVCIMCSSCSSFPTDALFSSLSHNTLHELETQIMWKKNMLCLFVGSAVLTYPRRFSALHTLHAGIDVSPSLILNGNLCIWVCFAVAQQYSCSLYKASAAGWMAVVEDILLFAVSAFTNSSRSSHLWTTYCESSLLFKGEEIFL